MASQGGGIKQSIDPPPEEASAEEWREYGEYAYETAVRMQAEAVRWYRRTWMWRGAGILLVLFVILVRFIL